MGSRWPVYKAWGVVTFENSFRHDNVMGRWQGLDMGARKLIKEGLTRRELVAWGAGAAALWGSASLTGCLPTVTKPRQVIFLVPDGMSAGVPPMAEVFSNLVRQRVTHWNRLVRGGKVTQGLFDTTSQNSLVTDSAAAATAWGSGRRVLNGMINEYRDGTVLTPLVPLLHDLGKATGLVTTARLTHATPAGFCAHVPHRDLEDQIAGDYLWHLPHVLLGGGDKHFDSATREDKRDLKAEYEAAGYALVRDRTGLRQAGDGRLLGLFASDHLPYALDHRQDGSLLEGTPTLAEMTEKALALLARKPNGFFLMVEGARVDHAAHANDGAGILWEQMAFDDAIGVALEFQKRRPETLIVIASDHGNANPGLNGMGKGYRESTGCFERLAGVRSSHSRMKTEIEEGLKIGNAKPREFVHQVVAAGTGYALIPSECDALARAVMTKQVTEYSTQQANFYGLLGQMIGNWSGVGWTGVTHTSDWTQILALGPGQEAFSGLLDNTDFYLRMADIFGITHRNPEDAQPPEVTPPAERTVADPTG
jgi:alkaline phosphatase